MLGAVAQGDADFQRGLRSNPQPAYPTFRRRKSSEKNLQKIGLGKAHVTHNIFAHNIEYYNIYLSQYRKIVCKNIVCDLGLTPYLLRGNSSNTVFIL